MKKLEIGEKAMHCNAEAIRNYPEVLRALPFCTWKLEKDSHGRLTKVPYNPRTGFHASVDKPYTFADMEMALKAVENYSGVGINISGRVGCIDVDGCVREDGSLTDTALAVMALFPDAWVEYSPSGTGLHVYFLIPEGYVYDKEEYYINCNKYGLEMYIAGETSHFLTITGNVFRTGGMTVTGENLDSFKNTYMKRPALERAEIQVPEGGSILSDEEVMVKCYRSQGGETFARYYDGDWTKPGDPNWSHSQADLSVCRRLAFFCRGDMEQMDRLFRNSGLYREKWDERRGDGTYGELTMRKAIAGCTAFYDRKPNAADDFAPDGDENEQDSADERNFADDASDPYIADDEHMRDDDSAARIDEYLFRKTLSVEDVIAPAFLELASWANTEDVARYVAIRKKIPRELGIRRFEAELRKYTLGKMAEEMPPASVLRLSGCQTRGMIVPQNWIVDDQGIRHMETAFGELQPVTVCRDPLFVSAKVINVDDNTEKLGITYRRNGAYKTLIASRADLLNKNTIIKYADFGLPVSSGTAGTITKYIAEMEAANDHAIPIKRCVNRAGWVGNEFYPYRIKDTVQYYDDQTGTTNIVEALHTHGSEERWLELAKVVREYPYARLMMAAAFASPLIVKLSHRNIYAHFWYESRGGKTAVAKFCLSIYGNPDNLIGTYNATLFGMEQRAATMKHLPLVLDELQSLKEKYLSVNDIVYNLGNGIGKTRGKIGSGIRKMDGWSNCIISTGEQPMRADSSMDGINSRLMEINACPLMNGEGVIDQELGVRLHTEARLNYGFAGKRYVVFLIDEIIRDSTAEDGTIQRLDADFQMMLEKLAGATTQECRSNPHFTNMAVLALGDYYSSIALFGLSAEKAAEEAVTMAVMAMEKIEADKPLDSIEAAWQFTTNWVASNSAHFLGAPTQTVSLYAPREVSPIYGVIEEGKVYAIVDELNKALDAAGFSHVKSIKGFRRAGYIDTFTDSEGKQRSQTLKSIKKVSGRVYALNVKIAGEEQGDNDLPPFSDPEALPLDDRHSA